MRIGIFDSGLGGLMVLKRMLEKHPNHHYIYYGDTAHLPYGEKTREQLYHYSTKIIEFLLSKQVDLIIVACGTLSSTIYDELKKQYSIPMMDVIRPTLEFIKNKNYSSVGVIGTTMTIQSGIFERNIANVKAIACPKFVPIIEKGLTETDEMKESINDYLYPFKENKMDALILGCTHYPIIQIQIKEYLKYNIDFIDMGKVVSNTVLPTKEVEQTIELYFSKVNEDITNHAHQWIENAQVVELILEH